MKRLPVLFLLAVLLVPLLSLPVSAVDIKKGVYVPGAPGPNEFAVSIDLLGDKGQVYSAGKEIQLSFQTTKDAYVVIYNIDSEGYVHLLYPEEGRSALSDGRKTYFLPPPGKNEHWETGGTTGIEYIHAVAVTDRGRINEDELYFLASEEKRFRIDTDPFLSFNMIDEELVRNAETDPPATDYTYFYINRHVEYPRYLCSKCHSQEKLSDPYAMECPEIVIEKVSYDEEPHYPYPALYDIRHVGEESDEDAYTSDRYSEKWLDEGESESDDSDDVHLRMSVSYGGYYPMYHSWPYYGPTLLAFDPFYWDPFWWDFNWYWSWSDWYWWPSFGSWYPPFYYWGHHYRYPWWGWDHDWWACDGGWGRCGDRYRPVYGTRTVQKRLLDYTRTAADARRVHSISGSRLDRAKGRNVAQRLERSSLGRWATAGEPQRTQLRQSSRGVVRNRETERTVIYGAERSKRGVDRTGDRVLRTRSTDRTGRAIDDRSSGAGRTGEIRRTLREKNDYRRDVIRRSAPERKSTDPGKRESTRERSRSGDGNRSSVDTRRVSGQSTEGVRSSQRSSSPAEGRAQGEGARSTRGGAATGTSSAKTSSPPATVKSRSR